MAARLSRSCVTQRDGVARCATPQLALLMAAWIGRARDAAETEIRIEAGSYEGRIVLFARLEPWELKNVGAPPERFDDFPLSAQITLSVIVLLVIGGGLLARMNIQRGRADRRGADRLAAFIFVLTALWQAFRVNNLFSVLGLLGNFFPILGTALLYSSLLWCWYIALEPYARRIWPLWYRL